MLSQTYDFVTATEVVEHFREPKADFSLLWSLVKQGGYLGLMTRQALDVGRFSNWHYKNDPTHISFWRKETFEWFASKVDADLVLNSPEVVILKKASPKQLA